VKKSTKTMFLPCSRSLRKSLHEADKHPHAFLAMTHTIPKPDWVVQANGQRVKYEGP